MNYISSEHFQLADSAVALGKFEGIHLGHQLLLNEIKEKNHEHLSSVVFTFDIPPRLRLTGDTGYRQIYTREERHALLEDMGIDVLIEYPFTSRFAALSPDEFVRDILVGKAGAKVVVVGTDFRFGRNRSGGIEDLARLAKPLGYKLIVKEKLQDHKIDISSSRIHALIKEGKMEEASRLLGRPFSVTGQIVHGKQLGRTIQAPTINQLADQGKLLPPRGVYVSNIQLDGDIFFGITNIGLNPTVESGSHMGVETHIFDFDRDIYGKTAQVSLLHYCRPEMKFDSVELLKEQIGKDIAFGKEYLDQKNF